MSTSGYLLDHSNLLPNLEVSSSDGLSTCPTLMHSLNSHSDYYSVVPYMKIFLIGQLSIVLLRGHISRQLATAHESVKA